MKKLVLMAVGGLVIGFLAGKWSGIYKGGTTVVPEPARIIRR